MTQLTLATRDVDAPRAAAILHVAEIALDDRSNPRFEREEMAALQGSLGRRGQLQNINVVEREEPDADGRRYDLVAGRSRYAAIREMYEEGTGTGQLLAVIHPPGTTADDARAIGLTENLQRVQMKTGEIARAIHLLATEGRLTIEAIADELVLHRRTVAGYLRLARTLPANALYKLDQGKLTKAAAEALLPLARRARPLVDAVVQQAGETIAASDIAANPDLVTYEAVRDRRINGTYAEPFTGGLDVLDVSEVLSRAASALELCSGRPTEETAAVISGARALIGKLDRRERDERLAHVEPSDVHRIKQTAPAGAIVDLATKLDDDGEILSRAVVCTNPTLMLEWATDAAQRILDSTTARAAEPENNLLEQEAAAIDAIKSEAVNWNRQLASFCEAISNGDEGCDVEELIEQLVLGACHLHGQLRVGQGLGHVRGDWRQDELAVDGGVIESRHRPPLGAEEAQQRFEHEIEALEVRHGMRLTAAAIAAGALCDTREVGGRLRNRQLRLPIADDSPAGRMAPALAALADVWEPGVAEFAETVRNLLDLDQDGDLPIVDPSTVQRRSRR